MNVRSQLLKFLSHLDLIQVVNERQALIRYAGLSHLKNKINWEGNALTFVDGFLMVLAQEGREILTRFLTLLEQSDFIGLDKQKELHSLYKVIEALSAEQWVTEFISGTYLIIENTLSHGLINVLIGFSRNINQEDMALILNRKSNKSDLQSIFQKTELVVLGNENWKKLLPAEEINLFLRLPEVEEVMRQLYAARLINESNQQDMILQELGLLLGLHTQLKEEDLTATASLLFDALAVGCDQALQIAKNKGILPTREKKSAFISHLLTDHLLSIEKNLAFLIAQQKLDIQAVLDFEEKYRQQVAERHNSIRPPFIEAAKDVPITKLYVPSAIGAGSRSHDNGKQHQTISLDAFLGTIYRTVLLGNPGGGKSTFAHKLCYDLATHFTNPLIAGRQVTPILVVLRKYGEKKKTHHYSILKFIEVTAESDYQMPTPPPGAIEYLLRNGRALVIFDGLDELLDTSNRQEISKDVESFCAMYPTVPVLVTSREVGYDQAPLNEEYFHTYHLSSFNEAQVREYVTKWFNLVHNLTEEERHLRIDSFMNESQQVPDLRSNPLMLALMCNIYRGEGYIPENRPDLYEKCADMLFKQWDKGRGIAVQIALSPRTRFAMMFLAHWIYTNTSLQEGVTENQLISTATTHLCPRPYEDRDEAEQAARDIIEFCRGRAWVFTDTGTTKTGEKLYQFTHRTFLEFFTAAHLVRTHVTPQELVKLLMPKIVAKEWDVVAQLAFHISVRQTAGAEDILPMILINKAQGKSNQEAWNLLSFTARCLAFILPSQVVLRKITTDCVERCLKEGLQSFSKKSVSDQEAFNRKSGSFPVSIIGELLDCAEENRTTIMKTLEHEIIVRIDESEDKVAYLASQLGLYLALSLHASTGYYRPELYRFWNEVAARISHSCSERLKDLSAKYLLLCQKGLSDGVITITEIINWHGLESLFKEIQAEMYSFVVFGSISEDLLGSISLFDNIADSDLSRHIHIFQELEPFLLTVNPPWIEKPQRTHLYFPERLLFLKESKAKKAELDLTLLDSQVIFAIFCLFATHLEAMIAHAPNDKDKDAMLRQYIKKPTKSPINVLRLIFLARYEPVKPDKVEEEMIRCGFTPQQQAFVWQWVRQEVDLVQKKIKQLPLGVDEEGLGELSR